MHFLLILAVAAALVAADAAPAVPLGEGTLRLAATLAIAAVAPLVALVVRWFAVHCGAKSSIDRRTRHARLRRLHIMHAALWILSVGVIVYGLSWPQFVRADWQLGRWPLADDVAILTPLLLPLAVSWPLFCDIECAWFAAGVDATRAGSRRRQYTVLRARHYLGLILVPVLALVAVDDGVKLIWPTLQGSAYSWLPLCIPLVLLLVLFPQVLRFVWGARPLADGPLRRRLMAAGRASSFVPREFLVWNTGRTIVNAAVAGFLPRLRYVFLSDGLVEKFDEVEVVAVFAHETGHIRCRHLATRGLVMLIPVAVWLGLCTVAPGAIGTANRTLADWGISSPTQLALAAPLGLALYSAVVVSWCSRLLEFEADLWACRSLAEQSNVASAMSTYTSVLEKLAATSGLGRRRSTWLHPSIVQRLEFLRRALTEPAVDRRFVFQLRLAKALATAGFAGIVASLVAVVVSGLTG